MGKGQFYVQFRNMYEYNRLRLLSIHLKIKLFKSYAVEERTKDRTPFYRFLGHKKFYNTNTINRKMIFRRSWGVGPPSVENPADKWKIVSNCVNENLLNQTYGYYK